MASTDAQGTELFLSTDGTTIAKFDCPTAITGLGYSTAEINEDCLDAPFATTRPGRKTLSPFTVPFIVQRGSEIHQWLLNSANSPSELIPYAIADSDGLADPTLTDGEFVAPIASGDYTRTVAVGTGYIGNLTIDYNNGDLKRGSFTFSPQTVEWQFLGQEVPTP